MRMRSLIQGLRRLKEKWTDVSDRDLVSLVVFHREFYLKLWMKRELREFR